MKRSAAAILRHTRHGWAAFFSGYRPQPWPTWVAIAISGICAFAAVGRGADLVFQKPPPPSDGQLGSGVNAFVDILGQQWWGWLILIAGLMIILGLALRRTGPLLIAHAVGAGAYFGYAVALAQGVALQGGVGGYRFITTALTAFALNALRAYLLGREIREIASEADAQLLEDDAT